MTSDGAKIDSLRKEMAGSAVRRFLRELEGLGITREAGMQLLMEEEDRTDAEM